MTNLNRLKKNLFQVELFFDNKDLDIIEINKLNIINESLIKIKYKYNSKKCRYKIDLSYSSLIDINTKNDIVYDFFSENQDKVLNVCIKIYDNNGDVFKNIKFNNYYKLLNTFNTNYLSSNLLTFKIRFNINTNNLYLK